VGVLTFYWSPFALPATSPPPPLLLATTSWSPLNALGPSYPLLQRIGPPNDLRPPWEALRPYPHGTPFGLPTTSRPPLEALGVSLITETYVAFELPISTVDINTLYHITKANLLSLESIGLPIRDRVCGLDFLGIDKAFSGITNPTVVLALNRIWHYDHGP
jgi:hypothetical protein